MHITLGLGYLTLARSWLSQRYATLICEFLSRSGELTEGVPACGTGVDRLEVEKSAIIISFYVSVSRNLPTIMQIRSTVRWLLGEIKASKPITLWVIFDRLLPFISRQIFAQNKLKLKILYEWKIKLPHPDLYFNFSASPTRRLGRKVISGA